MPASVACGEKPQARLRLRPRSWMRSKNDMAKARALSSSPMAAARWTRYLPPITPVNGDTGAKVFYIGQLYPWKGIDVLIRAMAEIAGAELVVVGGLPPEPDLEPRATTRREAIDRRARHVSRFRASP